MTSRSIRANSPNLPSQSNELELPTLGRKRSKSEPKKKEEWELEIEREVARKRAKRAEKEAIRLAKYEEEKKRHEDASADTRRFLEESKTTREQGEATIAKIGDSTRRIDETEEEWQKIKDQFDHGMHSALTGRGGAAHHYPEPIEELQQIYGVPKVCSITEIAARIKNAKSICVLVGIDVSTGINSNYKNAAIMTASKNTLLDFWRKQIAFKQKMLAFQPNAVHHAAARLVHYFNSTERTGFVVTQNVDGFDKAVTQGGEVFEIHGNIDYMRSRKQNNDGTLYPSHIAEMGDITEVPTSPRSRTLCEPHILPHNEDYNELFYKSDTVQNLFDVADTLIVLGTSLEKGLPKTLQNRAQKRKKLILECSPEPKVLYGQVMVNKQPMLEGFPSIVEKITAGFN